jgi:hypothetical protein
MMGFDAERPVNGLPTRIGPAEFGTLGTWITVRCPRELMPLMRRAGGVWDWLIERRIGSAERNDTRDRHRRAMLSTNFVLTPRPIR